MIWIALVLGIVWGVGVGIFLERNRRTGELSPHEAWENGCQHGVRLAHGVLQRYRKPWINYGEERGWDLARQQLTGAVAELLPETHPGETNPTPIQARSGGVS